jgi:hypothetical protein
MDEVNCKDTSSVKSRKEEGHKRHRQSAVHHRWYRVIESMYKTSPKCNKGRINDE